LLAHVGPGVIKLSKKLKTMTDKGHEGVDLLFQDGTSVTADLVVGADGIRSVRVVKKSRSQDPQLSFVLFSRH
jgi:salicylate hydroxylase